MSCNPGDPEIVAAPDASRDRHAPRLAAAEQAVLQWTR
jgi:hypothetical protein